MSSSIVFPQGSATVVVGAAGSLAVASFSDCTVERVTGFVNQPTDVSPIGTVNDSTGMTVFGPYSAGAVLIVNAGASPAYYETGAAPVVKSILGAVPQGAPTAVDVTGAVSAAAIFSGIVTSSTAAAVAGTIPTGAVMDAAGQFSIGDSFDWSVTNTGPNTFTVTAAASGHTLVGSGAVATATAARFRSRKTAAQTFVCYRIA
jgi:hypothetical protein